jgi:hypothetical protein
MSSIRFILPSVVVAAALAGCDRGDSPAALTTRGSPLTQALAPSADTFINSASPDNNNGASPSIYTGENGQTGLMRGLIMFALPGALQGQVTVSRVTLTLVTQGTGTGDLNPPTAATESLQAVTVAWSEGAGFGSGMTANTVGQACGTTGATWDQPNCIGGSPWTGGSVSATVSGTASVPAALDTAVTWDSATDGNAGMVADVQAWIDSPDTNQGWRISSSTEGMSAQAQRFYSREGAGHGPSLSVTLACRVGLVEIDGGCVPSSDSGATQDGDGASSPVDGGIVGGGQGGGCSCSLADSDRRLRDPVGLFTLALVSLLSSRPRRRREPR